MADEYQSKDPLINKWIDRLHMRGCSPLTRAGYARDVGHFAQFLGEDGFTRLPDATTEQLQAFFAKLKNVSHKPRSIRRKRSALSAFFTWLRRDEKSRIDNPVQDTVTPKPGTRLPKVLPKDEVPQLLSVTITHAGRTNQPRSSIQQARDRVIILLFYTSGVRRAETAALNRRDANMKERSLRVIGKRDKERIVIFNKQTAQALQAYLDVRPISKDDALFLGRGRKRMTPNHVGAIFKQYAKRSGIATHATPHVMRHTYGKHMLESGVDLATIQRLLGHQSLATTGIYLNVSTEHMRKKYDEAFEDPVNDIS